MRPGTWHDRHPLVLFLQSRGWIWGGNWGYPDDLHHFQKVDPLIAKEVETLRNPKVEKSQESEVSRERTCNFY